MVAPLEEVHLRVEDPVDQAVRSGQPARPDVGAEILERFRLSNARERITEDRLHQVEEAESCGTIGFDEVTKIGAKGFGEDRDPFGTFSLQGRTLGGDPRWSGGGPGS